MEEWKKYLASDFCINVTDGTHDSPKPNEVGHYLITSKHLKDNSIDFSSAYRISDADYQKVIKRSKVEQHDLLFSMIGTIGNVVRVSSPNVDFAVKNMAIFQMGGDEIRSKWLFYWLKSPKAKEYISARLAGSTQSYLTLDSLRQFPVYAPSISKMEHIVKIFTSIDDKIELNNQINHNLEEQLNQLYQSFFANNFNVVPLSVAVKTTSGGTPSRKVDEYYGGSIPWVKSKELIGSFISHTEENITEKGLSESSAKLLPTHSVLLAMYGATVGEFSVITRSAACNQAICAIMPNEQYPLSFLYMFVKVNKESLINKAIGSAQQNISQEIIKQLEVCADIEKIHGYDIVAHPIMEILEKNSIEIDRLSSVRDSLLPKLMSGELSVNSIDC